MAKRLEGKITRLGSARIRRGEIEFDEIALSDESSVTRLWKRMSMERSVADQLRPGIPAIFYYSPMFDILYGIRNVGQPGIFETLGARWYTPWLSLSLFLCGVGTSMFLFPILVALAGLVGIVISIDARVARARFRRDGKITLRASERVGTQMCGCAEPDARFDQFREWRSMPIDKTEGRFAEVSILECLSCRHLWVRYQVEYEGFSKSGRWARGRVDAARAATIRSEEVPDYLAGLGSHLFGGSRFEGASGTQSGPMLWGT